MKRWKSRSNQYIKRRGWVVDYISKHPGAFTIAIVCQGLILNKLSGCNKGRKDLAVKIVLVRTDVAGTKPKWKDSKPRWDILS